MIDIFTDYSLLGSLIKPDALVKYAKNKNWSFAGIADKSAGGLLDFYLECKSVGIKPVLGLRFNIVHALEVKSNDQIILYAQNFDGYHNLLRLFSKSYLEGFKEDQNNLLVDWLTTELGTNLLCVLPIGESPNESQSESGHGIISSLKKVFKDKLFFGLYDRNCSIDDIWLRKAHKANTPYLFLSGARYFKSEDFTAYKTLRAINERNTVERMFETVYLDVSLEKAEEQFKKHVFKEYLDKFLSLIDIDIPIPGLKVPKFSIPEGFKDSYDYILSLCRKGYKSKEKEFSDASIVKSRMATELDVIKRCNLADYFLLVYDICQYCDTNNIPRGIGRGSVGGCLVAYLLDISKTDPLKYNLLFERFLNEDRTKPIEFKGEIYLTDAPDIDLDIGQMQRQQVIDFLREEYGNVSKIATYTTLSAKACLKDCIRAHGKTEQEAAYVASFVEIIFGKSSSIEDTYKIPKFKEWADQNKDIYNIALKLEDVKKNSSIHAAGIVVSNESIDGRAPLFLANSTGEEFKRDTCSAYSLDISAKAGLLKMDLLGIRSLNVLQDAVAMVDKTQKPVPIKMKMIEYHIPEKEPEPEILPPVVTNYQPQTYAWKEFLKEHA